MKLKFLIWIVFLPQILWSQSTIEKEITSWEFRMIGDSVWKPAKVPGTIIDNFVDLSDISNPLHPYYGDNEKLYQWIGERDWEFRTHFQIDEDLIYKAYTRDILFGCLDLYADVYINDIQYKSNNAFIPLEVKELRGCSFDIRIIFHSTQKILNQCAQHDSVLIPGGERVYARTAQYQFGWDWGPKFVNMGLRNPIILKVTTNQPPTISTPKFSIIKHHKKNILICKVEINPIFETFDTLDICIEKYKNGHQIDKPWFAEIHQKSKIGTSISDPELWWPNGMDHSPVYYEFVFKIKRHNDTIVLDEKRAFYAFCNIQLIQEKDTCGESFYFTVNGEKVFAKGANYVPDDSFHPGKNTRELIRLAREANMNMLRVWGGGTYPNDDFYIECMKNGIMVWQDFMFACSMNPGDEFLDNVALEASTQVERLKGFNNIAVWCGNNENEEGWKNWGWQRDLNIHGIDSIKIWNNYDILFNKILPETISNANQLYGSHFNYISTSPKHGWGRNESMTEGDSHYWGVWWGLEPLGKYEEKVPRFMSEFGMQGMPDPSTLQKVIPDSAMNFDSPKFKNHQKHPTGFQTLNHYLKEYLVIPTNIEDYAYATQILQAYALTTAIEAQRRAMPYCMGSLIWQLNDCWPVTSWSLIDSELKNKIAYWEVKKSFEPIHISIEEADKEILIQLINDQRGTVKGKLELEINNFYGKNLWSAKKITSVSNGKVIIVYKIEKLNLREFDLNEIYLKATFTYGEKTTETFYHFVKPKQLTLPQAQFIVEDVGDYNSITVTSNVYAPFAKYESFYFGHLEPGKPKKFWIYNIADADAILFNPKKVRCLNQLLN